MHQQSSSIGCRWLTRLALALAAIVVAVGASADTASSHRLFMWEVSAGGKVPSYVLGSLHAARPDFYPLPDAIERAYERTQALVVEVDVSDAAKLANAAPLMTYAPPDALDRHLKPSTWKRLEDVARASQQDVRQLRPVRAAPLAEALTMGALSHHGYDLQSGIDLHFLQQAHGDGKPVEELETLEFQLGLLAGLSDEDSDRYLNLTIDQIKSGEIYRDVDRMALAWKAGDADALAQVMAEEFTRDALSRKLSRMMLDDRNGGMADKIAGFASAGRPVFVVVGAAHLVGPDNVLDRLRRRGLEVRQLQ